MTEQTVVLYKLEGKVALITGGASGIGEAMAKLFAKHGAKVVVADIQDELGVSLCQSVGSNEQLSYIHCDVTNEHDVQRTIDTVTSKHRKLDIMFSNAAIEGNMGTDIATQGLVDLKRVFSVNVFGAFLCAKHAARVMVPSKTDCILFTTSETCEVAGLANHPYTSSKHAVVGLMKNLCVELGHGIRVNSISPHVISTPATKRGLGLSDEDVKDVISETGTLKGTILEANDVAEAALYLSSDESKYVSGHNLLLDRGYSTTNPTFAAALSRKFT